MCVSDQESQPTMNYSKNYGVKWFENSLTENNIWNNSWFKEFELSDYIQKQTEINFAFTNYLHLYGKSVLLEIIMIPLENPSPLK